MIFILHFPFNHIVTTSHYRRQIEFSELHARRVPNEIAKDGGIEQELVTAVVRGQDAHKAPVQEELGRKKRFAELADITGNASGGKDYRDP